MVRAKAPWSSDRRLKSAEFTMRATSMLRRSTISRGVPAGASDYLRNSFALRFTAFTMLM